MKMQSPNQMLQLKMHGFTARQCGQLAQDLRRPLSLTGKSHPLVEQQRFDAALGGRQLSDVSVPQLHQMTQLAINRRRHMNALQLLATQVFRKLPGIEPISLHSLSRRRRYHRGSHDQTRVAPSHQLIVKAKASWPGFVNKRHSLLW